MRLPDFQLTRGSSIAESFLSLGIKTFADAAVYVREIPYGRNSNKTDRLLVLSENRGTCSGKHALLAELAHEHNQPIFLYFGFFKISKNTHPVVASVLSRHGLSYYPELHAYLMFDGKRYDFTGKQNPIEPTMDFLEEFRVQPSQVESYKEKAHKDFLVRWIDSEGLGASFTLEKLWMIREECIAARSEP